MKKGVLILNIILLVSTCFIIGAYGATEDPQIWLDKATYFGYGPCPIITLVDDGLNVDPKRRDTVNVNVNSSSDTVGISVTLTETTSNSGEFAGEFALNRIKSDDISKTLRVGNKDSITVTYAKAKSSKGSNQVFTRSATWQATTGDVKLLKKSYIGLNTIATVSVNDKDLNLRDSYIDTARVRIYSEADPKGIFLTAYETGSNTSTFAVKFRFSIDKSSIRDAIIKVNPSDNIYAEYIDEMDDTGAFNVRVISTSTFQFAEAVIKTSALNDEGSGNFVTVTIEDPDVNNPIVKDRLIAKASSGNGAQEKTIWLVETGINTGIFKCKLLLSDEMTNATTLRVKSSDIIDIKYTDNTIPDGGTSEVVKSVKWDFVGTMLRTDKPVYSGYNTSVRITLIDYTLNTDEEKTEKYDVRVTTSDSKGIKLELMETSANSGEFVGTLKFGKSNKASAGIIRVDSNETITVSYTNPKDDDDYVECSFEWSYLDGRITLDKAKYSGNDTVVKVTVVDPDASDNDKKEDEIRVLVRTPGGEKETKLVLKETSKSSGNYTGTFYINGKGAHKPTLDLESACKFEVVYVDEYNTTGKETDRIVSTDWLGISEAKLKLDRQKYTGYGDFVLISLIDPDQDKNSSERDKVNVTIRTKSGKTNATYELIESDRSNGEFIANLEFTEGQRTGKKISVAPDDTIYVSFSAKGVSATATFTKE